MLFFSGLRGAVSYALVRTFPQTGNELGFTVTCMVIVLITTFVLGGTMDLALRYVKIPTGVDEKQYLQRLERRRFLRGPVRRFEAYTLRRWVIRDFEKKTTEEEALSQDEKFEDDIIGDEDEMLNYVEHIEMTEHSHKQSVGNQRITKKSLFNFGNNKH
jgi:NhaP-type Na+/H+ or K+/H+ antiporter